MPFSAFTAAMFPALLCLLFVLVDVPVSTASNGAYQLPPDKAGNSEKPTAVYESAWWTSDTKPDEERLCVHDFTSSSPAFDCLTRAEHRQRGLDHQQEYNFGVPQRIDGSDTEKASIREVISLMKEYFHTEVMAQPAYKDVRHTCRNHYDLCAFWTALGECETNRFFMVPNCAAACRFCLLQNSGLGERPNS